MVCTGLCVYVLALLGVILFFLLVLVCFYFLFRLLPKSYISSLHRYFAGVLVGTFGGLVVLSGVDGFVSR